MPIRIPIRVPDRGHPYVSARVFHREMGTAAEIDFVVDTGAVDVMLSEDDADELGMPLSDLVPARYPARGIGGTARAFDVPPLEAMFYCEDNATWGVPMESIRAVENPRSKEDGKVEFSLPSLLGRAFIERHRLAIHLDFAQRRGSLAVIE